MEKYAFFYPVDRDTSLTGGPRTVANLLGGLRSNGIGTVLLSQKESTLTEKIGEGGSSVEIIELPEVLDVHDEQVMRYSLPKKFKCFVEVLRYNWRIASRCRVHNVGGLWARDTKGILLVGIAARLLGVPLIWDIGYEKPSRGLFRIFHWYGFGLASRIVTQSRRQFRNTFGDTAERIVGHKVQHIYPGIAEERYEALRDAASNEEENTQTILMVGSIHPRKNQAMAIRALAPLLDPSSGPRLRVVGPIRDQEYHEKLLALIDEKDVEDAVEFLGWRDDVPKLLGRSDVLVLSSRREGVPHVVREAMFAEIPVVATRVGGVPEAVRHGETGYLVDPQDREALRKYVRRLLRDPDRRRKMGEQGLNFAEERFSRSAWIDAYSEVLEAL